MQSNMLGIPGEEGELSLEDPQLQQLQGTEEATPEEEGQLVDVMAQAMEWLYSEKGMAAVANMFNKDNRELWQTIPDIGIAILQKVHGENKDVDPAVWFGENGMIQQLPALLFEVAEEMQVPGYDDPDQLAAATMGLYKAVGEYLIERGDKDAMMEARKLGAQTLLTGEDGEMMEPYAAKKKAINSDPEMKDLPKSVKKGLLGV